MSTWRRTALLLADAARVECALDFLMEENGMDKIQFIPGTITDEVLVRLWHSNPRSADMWIIALRFAGSGRCIIKTVPLGLMGECLPPIRTRPMLASICALLSCEGMYSSLEDSAHLLVASDASGGCQVTGLTFTEGEDIVWTFQQERLSAIGFEASELDGDNLRTVLPNTGVNIEYVQPDQVERLMCISGCVNESDLGDAVLYDMIGSKGLVLSTDWSVLAYRRHVE